MHIVSFITLKVILKVDVLPKAIKIIIIMKEEFIKTDNERIKTHNEGKKKISLLFIILKINFLNKECNV